MSKGHQQRPMKIPPEQFDQRWAETFGGGAKDSASYVFAMLREKWQERWNRECASSEALSRYFLEHSIPVERLGQFTHRDPDAG